MFNKKNHVGRPSNEELRKRRNKKILMVAAPIVLVGLVITLIATGSLSKLSGNSVISYYCEDSSYTLEGTNCVKTIVKKSALLADINSDKTVDENDLNLLDTYIKSGTNDSFSELQFKVADINSDGMVNEMDVQILEGYFSNVAATAAGYSEKIGVERICENGYILNGEYCEFVDKIPANKQEYNVEEKKEETNTNNTNTNTSTNNNNTNTTNNNTTNSNSASNNETVTTPVVATLKPENKKTNIKVNTKYKINVNFDIKDTSKQYYYIWTNYLYGEENYNTGCQKVTQGDHYGAFTMIGTRKVNVTVYSDSSCKTKVTSVDSKKYTCNGCTNMVDVSLKPQDNKTSFTKGTKYKMNVVFDIKDKENTYYYIWYNFLNGTNNYKTNCQKVTQGEHGGSFTIDGTKAVQVFVYSDSSCKNEIKHVTSKKYTCTNCTPLTISIGRNLSSSQTKGTVVHNGVIFNVNDKTNTYYYIWRTYTNGSNTYTSDCQKVTSGKEYVKDLTINGTRKGTITVYSDNKCTKRLNTVPVAETTTYTCSNCYVDSGGSSSYSDSGSSYSSGSGLAIETAARKLADITKNALSSGSSNTCKKVCPSGSKNMGGECFVEKYNVHASKVCKSVCPAGSTPIYGAGYTITRCVKNLKTVSKTQSCSCPSGSKSIGGECFKASNVHVNKVCAK